MLKQLTDEESLAAFLDTWSLADQWVAWNHGGHHVLCAAAREAMHRRMRQPLGLAEHIHEARCGEASK